MDKLRDFFEEFAYHGEKLVLPFPSTLKDSLITFKQLIQSGKLQELIAKDAFITFKIILNASSRMIFDAPNRLEGDINEIVLEIEPIIAKENPFSVESYAKELFGIRYYREIFSEFLDDCYIYYSCIQNDGSYNVKYLRAINLGYVGKRNKIETYDS